jgi:hypothetical protein
MHVNFETTEERTLEDRRNKRNVVALSLANILACTATSGGLRTCVVGRITHIVIGGRRWISSGLSSRTGSSGDKVAVFRAERSCAVNLGGNSGVKTSAVLSNNSSIEVQNINGAPTTLFRGGDARVAIRVFHARIINNLLQVTFQICGDSVYFGFLKLMSNMAECFLQNVEFTVVGIQALSEDKNSSGSHSLIKRSRNSFAKSSKSPGEDFYLRKIVNSVNSSVDGTIGAINDPKFVVKSLYLSLSKSLSRGVDNDSGIRADSSLPFSFHVSRRNLQTTVIS